MDPQTAHQAARQRTLRALRDHDDTALPVYQLRLIETRHRDGYAWCALVIAAERAHVARLLGDDQR